MQVSRRLPAAMQPALVVVFMTAIVISAPGQSAHAQHVIYVNASAAGTNDGTSWQDAFNDLQDGLDMATAAADCPCEVWVAGGVYKPDRGTGDRTMAFELVNNVGLYGGFAGWETRLDQRLPGANETILSGDLDDNDDPEPTNTDNNCCYPHDEWGGLRGSRLLREGGGRAFERRAYDVHGWLVVPRVCRHGPSALLRHLQTDALRKQLQHHSGQGN